MALRSVIGAVGLLGCVSAHAEIPTTTKACNIEIGHGQPWPDGKLLDTKGPPANCEKYWVVRIDVVAPKSDYALKFNPDCGGAGSSDTNLESRSGKLLQAAIAAYSPAMAVFSGPLTGAAGAAIDKEMKKHGGTLAEILSPASDRYSQCVPLMAIVPNEAKVVGYRLRMFSNAEGTGECAPGVECTKGFSMFTHEPAPIKNNGVQIVSTVFKNWSASYSRNAIMFVFYEFAGTPITEM